MILTKDFWKDTGVRAVKTFAQALIGFLGVGAIGIFDADWVSAISVSLMAALLAVLTAIANSEIQSRTIKGEVVEYKDGE